MSPSSDAKGIGRATCSQAATQRYATLVPVARSEGTALICEGASLPSKFSSDFGFNFSAS